jgi:hypothetical protein
MTFSPHGSLRCWDQEHERGSQARDAVLVVEAHKYEVSSSADDVAVVVQPGSQCPVGLVHRDLLDPAT